MNEKSDGGEHGGCHFVPGILAVNPRDLNDASEALGGAEQVGDERLAALLEDPETIGAIRSIVGLLEVDDPHRASAVLTHGDNPISSAPIHGVGFESHGRFMSGPGPTGAEPLSGVEDGDASSIIAVVDSGIVADKYRPDWMKGGNVLAEDPFDIGPVGDRGASHGTFVASVIRHTAPGSVVHLAAAKPKKAPDLVTAREGYVPDPPTHELAVAEALIRLVRRLGDRPDVVKALNLSLGASRACDNGPYLLTLRQAIDHWWLNMGREAPVFAAGGNSDSPLPVYPAAHGCVRGVAALNTRGDQVVWRKDAGRPSGFVEVIPDPRTWISEAALGVEIVGLSGQDEKHSVCWSGSSFATAIVSAQSANGSGYAVRGGITHWPDR